jgi:hypothetical protein
MEAIMKCRGMLILIFSFMVFLAYGCASNVYKHPLLSMEGQGFSAEVYFFRDETLLGSAFAIPVYLQEDSLLQLRRATYTKVYIKPGTYDMKVGSYSGGQGLFSSVPAFRSVTFEAGKAYFIHLKPESRATFFGLETYFKPELISEEQARILMTQYTLIPGPGD